MKKVLCIFLSVLVLVFPIVFISSCSEKNTLLSYQEKEYKFIGECNVNGCIYRGLFDISATDTAGKRNMSVELSYPETLIGVTIKSSGNGGEISCEGISSAIGEQIGIFSVFDLFCIKNPISAEQDGNDIVVYTENGNIRACFDGTELSSVTKTNGTKTVSVTVTERI
ncbi:MAG: hypothetical protein SOZ62_01675 [Eubacteriales bacterium]|nr:hypothetical protein [Eubacteriales bacterium]